MKSVTSRGAGPRAAYRNGRNRFAPRCSYDSMNRAKQTKAKQERIIEAVRHGLEGDSAVEFIHQGGYAMTQAGIARHLRLMGGRGRIQELVAEGLTNIDILARCFPEEDLSDLDVPPPSQGELFEEEAVATPHPSRVSGGIPLYETAKLTVRVPADLYEAIRLAAKVEGKTQNQLIVDILTSTLSKMPGPVGE